MKGGYMRRFIESLFLALVVFLAVATMTHAQTKNPLVGAWKVTRIENPDAAPLVNPQAGLYLFTEKHYSAVRLNGSKPLPDYASNDVATQAEKAAVLDMLYLNTGGYSVSGNKLTLSPQVAK